MAELIISILIYIAYLAFCSKRLMTYAHVLQQDDYDVSRLWQWIWANKVFDKRLSIALLAISVLWFFIPNLFVQFMIFAAFAFIAYSEKDPRKESKKALVITTRVQRFYSSALTVMAVMGVWSFFVNQPWFWIINVQLVPAILSLVIIMVQPVEQSIQDKYWQEAHRKITSLKPTTIAITGSFGKTSVKHILGHILKTQAPTLITPGSVNTPMGITRIIREDLEERHKYFIVEMGAYGQGSIERLCNLTPPDMGIITAIGHAHYERFKTLETVAEAKFELAEAVLANNGKVIVHDQTLRFDHTQNMAKNHPDNFIVCGPEGDLQITDVIQSHEGLRVSIVWQGELHELDVPLFGLHHGHNAALAFAMAAALGIDTQDIHRALKTLPQIAHRLEVKKQPDGRVVIDDAFNSNPTGFKAALDLMESLKMSGRKILITPGMVELGNTHEEAHDTIGKYAARICDVVIAVNPGRIPSFIQGVKSVGKVDVLHKFQTFEQAQKWVNDNREDGDIILIENDLPDMYERIPRI